MCNFAFFGLFGFHFPSSSEVVRVLLLHRVSMFEWNRVMVVHFSAFIIHVNVLLYWATLCLPIPCITDLIK